MDSWFSWSASWVPWKLLHIKLASCPFHFPTHWWHDLHLDPTGFFNAWEDVSRPVVVIHIRCVLQCFIFWYSPCHFTNNLLNKVDGKPKIDHQVLFFFLEFFIIIWMPFVSLCFGEILPDKIHFSMTFVACTFVSYYALLYRFSWVLPTEQSEKVQRSRAHVAFDGR